MHQRLNSRTYWRAYAHVTGLRHGYDAHVLNLSRSGALFAVIDKHDLEAGHEMMLTIDINDDEKIRMQGVVAHHKDHYMGLECRHLDPTSKNLLEHILDDIHNNKQ